MNAAQLYESVTHSIIKDLEAGVAPWVKPWKAGARGGMLPFNSISNRSYSGINIPILWDAWMRRDYPTQGWLTYKQAQAAGGQVRSGEKGTHIVFTRKVAVKDAEEEDKLVRMLRTFVVFNEAQIDGLPAPPEIAKPDVDPQDHAQRFIAATQADIRSGGDRACYVPLQDYILLPLATAFETRAHYIATALHELCHWTGAKRRLDRDLTGRFRSKSYAAEELIAELGAAFLCARLGVEGKLRHAEYIGNWLQLLKSDDRAIFTAASKASQAADFLCAFAEPAEEAA